MVVSVNTLLSIRSTIEFLKEQNKLLTVKEEVDPVYEIAGIQKALDGSHALLFEKIKGYPGVRNIGNVFSSEEITAMIFGVEQFKDLKYKYFDSFKKAIPPRVVEQAPCQEVVITDNIDVLATMPLVTHSEDDAAPILGSGVLLVTALPDSNASDISFKRMNFRGKDWCSVHISAGSHLAYIQNVEYKGEKVPLTININTPPAVTLVAAGGLVKAVVPHGTDELGMAGTVQGSPIDICRAKTIDGYAIANSEWVIEGYITPEKCWETEAAEKAGKPGVTPLFPEWHGYLGKAMQGVKIEVTAITHRKDNPIFYTPLADSYEAENLTHPLAEAALYQLVHRIAPDIVLDVNTPHAFKQVGGLVIQVKKSFSDHDGKVKDIIHAVMEESNRGLIVAVDEDVDIYSADDILWTIMTRGIAEDHIFRLPPGGSPGIEMNIPARAGGLVGIDATLPFSAKKSFKRAHYPVDKIELSRWFSESEITAARALQDEYARVLSRMGA